jgi:hypothetical protein
VNPPPNARTGIVKGKGFVEVDGCGAGVLLIRRDCVATLLEKMPELSDKAAKKSSPLAKNLDRLIRAFDPMFIDSGRLSEDFAFCHRWRQCGGEIWANVGHEITHIGLHRFKGRYAGARSAPRISLQTGPSVVTGALPVPAKTARNGKATPLIVVRPPKRARAGEPAKDK